VSGGYDPVHRLDLVALIASAVLLAYIIEAVRRRRLREEYSVLWILTACVLFVLSLLRPALGLVSALLGIATPVNALFAVGFGFTTIILLHFSTVISRLSRENRDLAQRYALLVHELDDWRSRDASHENVVPRSSSLP